MIRRMTALFCALENGLRAVRDPIAIMRIIILTIDIQRGDGSSLFLLSLKMKKVTMRWSKPKIQLKRLEKELETMKKRTLRCEKTHN